MKKLSFALAALLALGLAGCASSEGANGQGGAAAEGGQLAAAQQDAAQQDAAPGAAAYTFTDDLGNEVTVQNPQRVVACMGSFANAWELAGGTLVGVSDDALTAEGFTIKSPDVARVGDFASVNLEAIIALDPDFVVMTSGTGGRGGDSSQADLREALVSSGIPVAYFEVTTFDDYLRLMRTFADITGDEAAYEQNAAAVQKAVEDIKAQVPAGEAPSVLVMTTYSGGTRVQAGSTMTGAMLAELGARNLADENRSLLKDFSLESVIELDPDFIFVIPMGNDAASATAALEAETAANPAWAGLTAVQSGHYITLDPALFLSKPNANWADSYQVLYDALYGETGA